IYTAIEIVDQIASSIIVVIFGYYIIYQIDNKLFSWNFITVLFSLALIHYMIFTIPQIFSASNYHEDIDIQNSKLPIVKVKNECYSARNRLLIEMNSNMYIIKLDSGISKPKVRILNMDDIEYIYTK
ncbi:MAG TPA: hypothetical protein VHO28_15270, partial [Ignavibacteriales bacterium]|nr:hypothetical protein [Ignavibacteriales bacterium]